MTEQKNEPVQVDEQPKVNLRDKYLALSEVDQKRIAHFFNLHNAAGFCYDQMSEDAKDYTNYCIQLSRESQDEK